MARPQRGSGGWAGLTPRLALAAAAAALLLGAVLAVLLASSVHLRDASRQAEHSATVLSASANAQRSVLNVETRVRGYVISADRSFVVRFGRESAEAVQAMRELRGLVADNPQQERRARALSAAVNAYLRDYARPLVALVGRDPRAARQPDRIREGLRRLNALRAGFAAFDFVERGLLEDRTVQAGRRAHTAIVLGVGALVALPLLVIAFAVLVWRKVARPVRRLSDAADLVRSGDLGARAPVGGTGEIEGLGAAFNAMTMALERTQATSTALLDAIFVQAPVGLAFFNVDGRYVRVNRALAEEINGVPAEEHVGRTVTETLPGLGVGVDASLRRALGGERISEEIVGETPAAPGVPRSWAATWFPVRGLSGEVVGAGVVVEETTTRRRLELAERAAARRTAALQAVTAALSGSLTEGEVLDVVVRHGRQALGADAAIVLLAAQGGLRLECARAEGPAPTWAVRTDAEHPIADVVRGGVADFEESRATLLERFPDVDLGPHEAWAILPLGIPARGALVLSFAEPRRFSAEDRAFIEAFAAQCGQALERARLFERERRIATALQRSLLPEALPEAPGLELTARYRPAGEGYEVGGDFYDVFELDDGRWLVAMGDVCGKGPEAAALTGVVRHALRAEALHVSDPARLLALVDEIVARESGERFVTAAVGVLDGGRLMLALAGHPKPFVVRADGRVEQVGLRGDVLGVHLRPAFPEAAVELAEGDVLVLYTDGLLDARAPRHTLTAADAAEELARSPRAPAAELLDRLERLALGDHDAPPRDDITLLAVARRDER